MSAQFSAYSIVFSVSGAELFSISANTLYGPMHTKAGVQEYADALKEIENQGGKIAFGGKVCAFFCIFNVFSYFVVAVWIGRLDSAGLETKQTVRWKQQHRTELDGVKWPVTCFFFTVLLYFYSF